jgi:hypothetical protein
MPAVNDHMTRNQIFAIAMIGIGIVTIIRGLTAAYLYNDTEGPISDSERERYKAKLRDRLIVISVGGVAIVLGVLSLRR